MYFDPYDDYHSRGTGQDGQLYWTGLTHYAYVRAGRLMDCPCTNCHPTAGAAGKQITLGTATHNTQQ